MRANLNIFRNDIDLYLMHNQERNYYNTWMQKANINTFFTPWQSSIFSISFESQLGKEFN